MSYFTPYSGVKADTIGIVSDLSTHVVHKADTMRIVSYLPAYFKVKADTIASAGIPRRRTDAPENRR